MSTPGAQVGPPPPGETRADVVELLELVTRRCVELLDVAVAAVLLADGRAALQAVAVSPTGALGLGVLQDHPAEGPCHDSHLSGRGLLVQDLAEHEHRWPDFVPAALRSGVRSVHAVPVRLGTRPLGVLGLFDARTGTSPERSRADALAEEVAAVLTPGRAAEVPGLLQGALVDRATIEQATGMLAESGDLDVARAGEALRRAARERGRGLSELARSVATGAVPADTLLALRP